jgi:Tfp pilus assembly protein PilV
MTITARRTSRGVSLIEAVVALAVMGFGMLGVAAMQSSIRYNADVARQRAEAVRVASEAIEALRSYSVVTASGKIDYTDIATGVPALTATILPPTIVGTNATYTRTVTVFDTAAQNRKTVQVTVSWVDRTNTQQDVRFSTEIHRSPPELAASLIVPGTGTMTQKPAGRNPAIPRSAVPNTDGTSSFSPPGGGPLVWVFNNTTGVIEKVCNPGCVTNFGYLLAGYISFATSAMPPTSVQSEAPPDNALPAFTAVPPTAGVAISLSAPIAPAFSPACFYELLPGLPAPTKVVGYYCIVPGQAAAPAAPVQVAWSGQSSLSGLSLALTMGDPSVGAFKVCRYTSQLNNNAVGTGVPALTNSDHPYEYLLVKTSLVNQNFLVIGAGDGTNAFTCPDDNVSTPVVNGRTWQHQPAS